MNSTPFPAMVVDSRKAKLVATNSTIVVLEDGCCTDDGDCQQEATSSYRDETSSSSSSVMKKKVQFESTDTTVEHIVPALRNMGEDEIQAVWYTKSEYNTIREEMEYTLKLVSAGLTDPERAGFCYRGIEARTDAMRQIRSQVIEQSIHAVLAAQEEVLSTEDGGVTELEDTSSSSGSSSYDSELRDERAIIISKLYKEYTIRSEMEAKRRGQWDERSAILLNRKQGGDESPRKPSRRTTWAKAG